MKTNSFILEDLQGELKRAFKWMAQATEQAKQGDFSTANFDMTVALQHWNRCQHIKDKFISDDDAEEMHWDFFTNRALAMAKQEVAKELKDEQENA